MSCGQFNDAADRCHTKSLWSPGFELAPAGLPNSLGDMFTIEHDFDATVITLIDEPDSHLQEDVTIQAFEDCVTVEQLDPRSDKVQKITLSLAQLNDLAAALDLPEGVYRLMRESDMDKTD